MVPATDTVRQVEALGRQAQAIVADVSSAADARRMVDEAVAALGHVDVLVNSAGVVQRESLLETTEAIWIASWPSISRGRSCASRPSTRT